MELPREEAFSDSREFNTKKITAVSNGMWRGESKGKERKERVDLEGLRRVT